MCATWATRCLYGIPSKLCLGSLIIPVYSTEKNKDLHKIQDHRNSSHCVLHSLAKVFKNRGVSTIKARLIGSNLAFSAKLKEILDEDSTDHHSWRRRGKRQEWEIMRVGIPQVPSHPQGHGRALVPWGRQSRSSNLFPYIQHQCRLSPLRTRDASMWKSVCSTQIPLPAF